MSYIITYSGKFKKSLKKCARRGLNINKLHCVISLLVENGSLPAEYRPHKLSGTYPGCWECHIELDWLLVWKQNDTELILLLVDTSTHSDLF